MKYKYILFDLDGTLTDPRVGITKSVQQALKRFNIDEPELSNLEKFIGPPLKDSFMEFHSFSEEEAMQAIEYYREYFKDTGIFENEIYEGIAQLVSELKNSGAVVAVATSKPTVFAKRVIEHFNITKHFDAIIGSNLDGTRSNKAEIVDYVIKTLAITDLDNTVMIGDRKYDITGAHKNNVASIGVTYGYGSLEELQSVSPTHIVSTVAELSLLLTNQE